MPLEVTTTIAGLVAANPSGTDDLSTADDHIRLVKQVLVNNIPLTTAATSIGITVLTASLPATARDAISALGRSYMQVRDEKATTVDGGASVAGDQARVLNTVVTNTITGASLAANQITLPVGTYTVRAHAPAINVNKHQLRLDNVTDATVTIRGTSEFCAGATGIQTRSFVEGKFPIAAVKTFALRHYTQTAVAGNGLGVSTGFAGNENYATIEIWQE